VRVICVWSTCCVVLGEFPWDGLLAWFNWKASLTPRCLDGEGIGVEGSDAYRNMVGFWAPPDCAGSALLHTAGSSKCVAHLFYNHQCIIIGFEWANWPKRNRLALVGSWIGYLCMASASAIKVVSRAHAFLTLSAGNWLPKVSVPQYFNGWRNSALSLSWILTEQPWIFLENPHRAIITPMSEHSEQPTELLQNRCIQVKSLSWFHTQFLVIFLKLTKFTSWNSDLKYAYCWWIFGLYPSGIWSGPPVKCKFASLNIYFWPFNQRLN